MGPIKARSHWTIDGTATIALGVGLIAGAGGVIKMHDPHGKEDHLDFGILGGGPSFGFKIPNFNVSGDATLTAGRVYMTEDFHGVELERSDFVGACFVFDVFLGLGAGVSGTAILAQVTPTTFGVLQHADCLGPNVATCLLRDALNGFFGDPPDSFTANALILLAGNTAGSTAGVGADVSVGYIG